MDAEQPCNNSNSEQEEKKRGTVSIRHMDLDVWYKTGYLAKCKGVTMAQYICDLLEQDISNQ